MDVAGLDPGPVHGRQVPDRIGGVAVLDQLGLVGRARGEVQQQRVRGGGRPVGREAGRPPGRRRRSAATRRPARRPRCACSRRARRSNFAASRALTTTWRASPRSTRSTRSRGPSSGVAGMTTAPSFIAASVSLPQLDLVAEHHDHPIPAPDALLAQPVRDLVRASRQLGERAPAFAAVLLDDPQRESLTALGGEPVEPVERPVELVDRRPAEIAVRGVVVLPVREQEVARRAHPRGRGAGVEQGTGS